MYSKNTVYGELIIRLKTKQSRVYGVQMYFEKLYFQKVFLCLFSGTYFCIDSYCWDIHKFDAQKALNELSERLEGLDYPIC